MGNFTILCVDNEHNVLLTLRAQLSRHFPDCAIEIAESGEEALEVVDEVLASGGEVPLVIVDQIMPGMKGDDLLIQIHGRYPQMVKVMLTGQARAQDVGNVVNRGHLYRFLAKPWNEADLTLTVTEALRRYQQEQQLAQQQLALEQANQDLATLNAALEQQVTDRTQDLESTLDFNQQVIATAQEGIIVWDQTLRYRVWNRFMEDLSGLPAAAVLEQYCLDLFPFLQENGIFALLERALVGETVSAPDAFFNVPSTGKSGWTSERFTPLRDAQGNIVGVLGTVHDITERKRIELALRESEAHNRAMMSGMADIMAVVSAEGQYLSYSHNQFGGELLPLDDRDLVGLHITEVLPQEAASQWRAAIEQVLATGEVQTCEQQIPFGDRIQYEEVRIVPYQSDQVLCMVQDISARKQLEAERQRLATQLQEREAFLENIYNHVEMGIYVIDVTADGDFLYADNNPAGDRLLGVEPGFLRGKYLSAWAQTILTPEVYQAVRRGYEQCVATGEAAELEEKTIVQGQESWWLARIAPLKNEQNRVTRLLVTAFSITDRKQSEVTLRESEEMFRQLAESMRDAFFICSPTLDQYLYLSPATEKIWGLTCEQLYQNPRSWLELVHPDDWDYFLANTPIEDIGTDYDLEYRILRPDGELRWVHVRSYPLRNEQNQIDRILGVCEDITDRKQAESTLQKSAARLAEAQRIAQVGSWEFDLATQRVSWSEELFRLYGHDASQGQPTYGEFRQQIPAEDWPPFERAIERAIAEGLPYVIEHRVLRPNGDLCHALSKGIAQVNDQGQTIRIFGTSQNITAAKQAQEALRASERRYATLAEAAPVGIFRFDAAGDCIYVNQYWCEMTGRSTEAALGKNWIQTLHPEDRDRIPAEWAQAFEEGGFYRGEGRYLQPNGNIVWFYCQVSPEADVRGRVVGYVGTVTDISDRKQAETALRQSEAKQRALISALPDLIMRIGRDGTYLDFFTASTFKVLGDRESLVGTHVDESLPPDQVHQRMTAIEAALRTGEIQIYEQELWIEGDLQIEECRVVACSDNEVLVVGRDITAAKHDEAALKQAEAHLRASQELLQLTLLLTGIGAWSWQPSTGAYDWNGKMEDLLEIPTGLDNMFQLWCDRIHPDDRDRVQATIQQALDTQTAFAEDYRYYRLDGRLVWRGVNGQGIYTATGDLEQVLGTVQDIDQRKQAEAALRASEQKNRAMLMAMPDLLLRVKPDGTCLDFIPPATSPAVDFLPIQQHLSEVLPPELLERQIQQMRQTLETRDLQVWEHTLLRYGVECTEEVRVVPCGDDELMMIVRDVSERARLEAEREQAEAALQESEEQLRLALDFGHIAIWDWDLVTGKLRWNDISYEILGYSLGAIEPSYDVWLQAIHPDDREATIQEVELALAEHRDFSTEYRVIWPDGTQRWLSDGGRGIHTTDGQVVRAVGVMLDITDRKQAELALAIAEAEQRSVLENIPSFVAKVDPAGTMLFLNRVAPGFTMADVVGRKLDEFTDPSSREMQRLALAQVFATGSPVAIETVGISTNGSSAHYDLRIAPAYQNGQIEAAILVSTDISDRKQAQLALQRLNEELEQRVEERTETLRQSELRYRAIVEDQTELICRFLPDATLTFVNTAYCRYFGQSPSELLGHSFLALMPPADQEHFWQKIAQLTVENPTITSEYQVIAPDGSIRWQQWTDRAIFDHQQQLIEYQSVGQDISERARLEAERKQAEIILRQYERMVEISPDGIALVDETYTYRLVNQTYLDRNDQQRQTIVGHSIAALMGEETFQTSIKARFDQCFAGETIRYKQWFNYKKAGSRFISVTYSPFYELDGSITGVVVTSRDETDYQAAEASLRDSEERLRLALIAANQGLYDLDLQTGEAIVSPEYASMLGYDPETFQETNAAWIARLHPDDLDRVGQTYLDYIAGTIPDYQVEFRHRIENGDWKWILSSGKIVSWDKSGQPLRMLGIHTDISDRKRAEQELESERLRLQIALEAANMGTWESSIESGIWSEHTEAIFGYAPGTFPGDREAFLNLVYGDDQEQVFGALAESFATRSPYDVEYRINRLDGELRWVAVRGKVVDAEDGTGLRMIGVAVDITDRKQAELALRDSEERFRATFEQAAVGMIQANLDGQFVRVNQKFCDIVGYSEAELFLTYFGDITHPDDLAKDEALVSQLLAGARSTFDLEKRYLRSDGSIVSVNLCVSLVRNGAGKTDYYIGIVEDISDRKQAEAEQQKLMALIETSHDFIGVASMDGQPLYRNAAAHRLVGLDTLEATKPVHMTDFFFPEDLETLQQEILPTVMTQGVWQGEFRFRHFKTGEPIAIDYTLFIVRDPATQQPVGLATVTRDIRDRKQSEAKLRAQEQFLRSIYEGVNQPIFVSDVLADGTLTNLTFNPATEQLMGRTSQEIAHLPMEDIFGPQEGAEILARYAQCIATQQPLIIEENITFQNQPRWMLTTYNPLVNDQGQVYRVVGTVHDITELKYLEQELRQINSHLEQRVATRTHDLQQAMEAAQAASRAKSSFLSNMSHELRTPLNAILGFSLLLSRNEALAVDEQHQISIINRSGQHLLTLINDILEMSKIEAGRATLSPNKFDLQQLLHHLEELFQLKAQSKGLSLTIPWEAQLPRYIQTDENKLRQVLTNLLSNAIKFTQAGSVTLRVQVDPTPHRPEALDDLDNLDGLDGLDGLDAPTPSAAVYLQFSVQDTGPGIDPSEQELLFKPFIQTQAGQAAQEGTGLGLPISQQFVRLMGGDLKVLSRLGEGATFFFEMPVVPVAASDLPPRPLDCKVVGVAPNQTQYRVLVVEDHWENRQFLVKLLRSIGLLVQEAENGQAAVRLWQQWTPHLIWMDMRMPVMDGYAATRQIRALEATQSPMLHPTKILALTASAFDNERGAILAAGCDDLVCKPSPAALLFDKMAEHMGVAYLYQAPKTAPAPPALPSYATETALAPLITALQTIPPAWIEQLHQAARMADEDLVMQCLEQIPPGQSTLLAALQAWVDDLRLDKLVALTTAATAAQAGQVDT